jgi:DNA-binding transcriptional ArsR family regulator
MHNHVVVDALSATFAALSDPTRRAILSTLATGPASITELAQPFGMSQQAVSKHVAYLERAQLVEKRRDGRQHVCQLVPEPLKEVASWVEPYRRHWEDAFTRLDGLLRTTQRTRTRKHVRSQR